jgi:hypothetical protein
MSSSNNYDVRSRSQGGESKNANPPSARPPSPLRSDRGGRGKGPPRSRASRNDLFAHPPQGGNYKQGQDIPYDACARLDIINTANQPFYIGPKCFGLRTREEAIPKASRLREISRRMMASKNSIHGCKTISTRCYSQEEPQTLQSGTSRSA